MKRRALTAMGWSGADILVRNGLQFVVTIILARLVAPEEFGTVAMLSLFIGLAGVMVDGGLSTALIQRQDVDHADESTVFWFNVGVGVLVAGLLGLMASPIATYFNHPVLAPLVVVGALTVFCSALGAVHTALLVKRLDFFTLLKAGGAAAVLSGSIAITLAVKGYGVWALAAQMISMACLNTFFLWMLNRWRPLARFSRDSLRKLLGFGAFVLAANAVDTFYNRAYTVLIGRYIGLGELGYYDRAEYARQLPAGLLSGIVARVALPIFSENAHDPVLLRSG
jgi:teichuronic acid exporter